MLIPMRLYRRNDSSKFYVEIERGKSRSLKTSDPEIAKEIFNEMVREELRVKMHLLDESERISLKKFKEKYLEGRYGLSENTTRADELALRLLGDVIGHSCAVRAIDEKGIEQFKRISLARGIKSKSVNTYLRHIKAALREAREIGAIKKVPRIKFIKEPLRLPKIFKNKDIHKILDHLREADYELWRIAQFALWTGCRRNEILNLKWQDVSDTKCRITGKGDKDRWVVLLPGAVESLGESKDVGRAFHPFHKDTVSHRFKEHLVKLGITGNFHMLRHTAATYMLNNGIPLPVIQKALGHADIKTTQIYAEVEDELLEKEMQKLKF